MQKTLLKQHFLSHSLSSLVNGFALGTKVIQIIQSE
jgi:hypothetical protein